MIETEPKTVTFEYMETNPKTNIRMVEIEVVSLETLKTISKNGPMKLEDYQNVNSPASQNSEENKAESE